MGVSVTKSSFAWKPPRLASQHEIGTRESMSRLVNESRPKNERRASGKSNDKSEGSAARIWYVDLRERGGLVREEGAHA